MKLTSPPILCLAALLAFTSSTHAATVSGSINFSSANGGGVVFQDSAGDSTTDLLVATGVQSWTLSEVDSGTGSFASVTAGSPVVFSQPWVFNPSTSMNPLWAISGPENFAFNLTSSTIIFQNQFFLAITGTGTFTGTNYDATPGKWMFSTQGSGGTGKFSWSSESTAASVPDGGTTIAFLGASLLGLCGLRRMLRFR